MTIEQLVQMAERIHNAERVNLGASSSREQRNAFWARVVGIVYWGHPIYNLQPDTQWHLKDGGAGRPQSDDVVVSLPSRNYWDCIPNAGADGYRFEAASHTDTLPAVQNVYAPPKPAGGMAGSGTVAPPVVVPPPVAVPQFPPRDHGLRFFDALDEKYKAKGYPETIYRVDKEGTAVWYADYLRHRVAGLDHAAAQVAVFAAIDAVWAR